MQERGEFVSMASLAKKFTSDERRAVNDAVWGLLETGDLVAEHDGLKIKVDV